MEMMLKPSGAICCWEMGLGKARLAVALCLPSGCKYNLIAVEAYAPAGDKGRAGVAADLPVGMAGHRQCREAEGAKEDQPDLDYAPTHGGQ